MNSSQSDFAILTQAHLDLALDDKTKKVTASLKGIILAQGSKSPMSPFYFELNVKDVSAVDPDRQKKRIDYIYISLGNTNWITLSLEPLRVQFSRSLLA